jgi:ketosteroid isomerase-like protein
MEGNSNMDISLELMVIADKLAIRELIDSYHTAINQRDWSLLSDLFAADALWEAAAPVNLRFEGHAAIMQGLHTSVGRQEVLVQSSSGLTIELQTSDQATARVTLSEFGREHGAAKEWRAIAFYYDVVIKQQGRWRFKQRSLRVRYMAEGDQIGQVFDGIL